MLGLVVLGSRTWIWTMAAPALAASRQEFAICSGVTGTAGFLPGVSAEPVTAQEIITLRAMPSSLVAEPYGGPRRSKGCTPRRGAASAPPAWQARLLVKRNADDPAQIAFLAAF